MLWTIFVILLILWLLGVVSSYTLGGFIHILLVIEVVALLFNLLYSAAARPSSDRITSSSYGDTEIKREALRVTRYSQTNRA
jgi:hypothetical protein